MRTGILKETKRGGGQGVLQGLQNIIASFVRLWGARDELHVRSMRAERAPYFIAFPAMLTFLNLEFRYPTPNTMNLPLGNEALLPLCFCIGSLMMLFVPERYFSKVARITCILTGLGCLMRFLPLATLQAPASILCWVGLGASGIGTVLYYCTKINNAERLIGVVAEVLIITISAIAFEVLGLPIIIGDIIKYAALAIFIWCIINMKPTDTKPEISVPPTLQKDSYWALMYIIPYFIIIQLFNEYIATPVDFSNAAHALGGLFAVLAAIIIQFICRRSSWHMWNVLILSAMLSILFFWIGGTVPIILASFFVGVFSYSGDIVLFYICAGVIKRLFSFGFFKRFQMMLYGSVLVPFVLAALFVSYGMHTLLVVLTVVTGFVLIMNMILSPALLNKLFEADWVDDFRRLDMTPLMEKVDEINRFEHLGLTPREREVAALLLKGYTARMIAGELHIAEGTVQMHSKNLYRKLGINSRIELFARFGAAENKENVK